MKQRFSEEQHPEGTRAIVQEAESAASKAEVCRKHGLAETTFYRWQEQYRGLTVSQLRKLKQLEQENERLKKLVAEQARAQETLTEVLAKKGIRSGWGACGWPSCLEHGISERLACRLVGGHRSSYRYPTGAESDAEVAVRATIRELARAHPRDGDRRDPQGAPALLRRQGERIKPKRVGRIWREEGLVLPRKRPRQRRRGEPTGLPTAASYRGHVWTDDFVFDRTERGQVLKMLVVLDEFTRECHRIRVGRRLDSAAVIATLEELIGEHGAPASLRRDYGGAFIAGRSRRGWRSKARRRWTSNRGIPGRTGSPRASTGRSGTSA